METRVFGDKNRKKGISLAEICVVLAVISLVSLTVVSFTLMVSARSRTATTELQMMEDARLVRSVVTAWLDACGAQEAEIIVNDEEMVTVIDGNIYALLLEEDRLLAEFPNGNPVRLSLSAVHTLTFEKLENTTDSLYYCHMTYTIVNSQGEQKDKRETFCIHPRVGEILTANGG